MTTRVLAVYKLTFIALINKQFYLGNGDQMGYLWKQGLFPEAHLETRLEVSMK